MTATTFDTTAKVNQTLSGGNLVATSTGAGGARSSRPLQGQSYWEMTITTLAGTPAVGVAVSNWNNTTALQSSVNSLGYLANGNVQINSVTLLAIAAYVAGDRIGVAVDPANRLIWFRVNNGNWNNNAANNPATGVGGIDYGTALTNLGVLFAAISTSVTANVWTAKFSTAFTDAAPAGYVSLDNAVYTVMNNEMEDNEAFPTQASDFGSVFAIGTEYYERSFNGLGPITVVSGVVQEGGVDIAGKAVEVYDRNTGELIGRTLSAGDGTWEVCALGRPSVRVVCSDPTTFNSLVYDNVTPV